ncbi:acetyl-CoA acetyltransferase 1-like [Phaseolus vulgaris]|uniref:acetyl-CoA acetyltransferase 1-like n=1 Tax=Phaseolus vulgaris TaxID=3885 RepID=UPI0035CB817D
MNHNPQSSEGRGDDDTALSDFLASLMDYTPTFDAAKLRKLRPRFKQIGGSVTSGNASSISDGPATLVIMSGEKARGLGLHVIAKIKGHRDAAKVL